jgi:hypothetical protein
MQPSTNDVPQQPAGSPAAGETPAGGKLAWNTPMVEEVPFTRTEAGGVGGVYDFTVYAGSR